MKLDLAEAGNWVAEGLITPEQLVFLADHDDDSLFKTIRSLLPVHAVQPAVFDQSVDVLFAKQGGPTKLAPNPVPTEAPKPTAQPKQQKPLHAKPVSGASTAPLPAELSEVVAICVDVSGSMQAPFETDTNSVVTCRTRLDTVKQMFYGFRDQTAAYQEEHDTQHRLGLLSYDHRITVHSNPTDNFDAFEEIIDDMVCRGATAIFEAITSACSMLAPWKAQHPDADLRVMVLSDGQNNRSDVTSQDALEALYALGAVCDCIVVGNTPDADLRKIVSATNGSCFQITTLSEGYECLESQAVVSLAARRNGAPKPVFAPRKPVKLATVAQAKICRGGVIIQQETVKRTVMSTAAMLQTRSGGGPVQRRMRKEMAEYAKRSGLPFHFFPGGSSPGRIDYVKVLLEGRKGTPYEGGIWEVLLDIPTDYPFSPPKLRFVTPIYHYAVTTQGGMCLDILKDNWSPAITLVKAMLLVESVIGAPEKEDPTCNLSLRSVLSELKRCEPKIYEKNARAHTQSEACKLSLQKYREALLGEE